MALFAADKATSNLRENNHESTTATMPYVSITFIPKVYSIYHFQERINVLPPTMHFSKSGTGVQWKHRENSKHFMLSPNSLQQWHA